MVVAISAIAFGIIGLLLFFALDDHLSGRAFWDAYHRAQEQDLLYAREHPGFSLEESHRERDKVLRRYHRD